MVKWLSHGPQTQSAMELEIPKRWRTGTLGVINDQGETRDHDV
jgi:hypothetical protein